MDDIVLRGMTRWPDVPAVFGWLALDRRGRWRLRGETIRNTAACEFINRNYTADEHGRWFFQNGPQRVFVTLQYTPLVVRLAPDGSLHSHTGARVTRVEAAYVDDGGALLLATDAGAALLADNDLADAAQRFRDPAGGVPGDAEVEDALAALVAGRPAALAVELGGALLAVSPLVAREAPARLGYVRDPQGPEC